MCNRKFRRTLDFPCQDPIPDTRTMSQDGTSDPSIKGIPLEVYSEKYSNGRLRRQRRYQGWMNED